MDTTNFLQKILDTESTSQFFQANEEVFTNESFHEYINNLCKDRNKLPADIIKKSGIERIYGHQIFRGVKKPLRDNVLKLAFGFEMDFEETQGFLRLARKTMLYPKIKRDAAVIFILKRNGSIDEIQDLLLKLKLPLLGEVKYNE